MNMRSQVITEYSHTVCGDIRGNIHGAKGMMNCNVGSRSQSYWDVATYTGDGIHIGSMQTSINQFLVFNYAWLSNYHINGLCSAFGGSALSRAINTLATRLLIPEML